MAWYRSIVTKRIVHEKVTASALDNIWGRGTFEKLVEDGTLELIESPSVVDILKETRSSELARIRYQELNNCTYDESRKGVEFIKADMAKFRTIKQKRDRKHE